MESFNFSKEEIHTCNITKVSEIHKKCQYFCTGCDNLKRLLKQPHYFDEIKKKHHLN